MTSAPSANLRRVIRDGVLLEPLELRRLADLSR